MIECINDLKDQLLADHYLQQRASQAGNRQTLQSLAEFGLMNGSTLVQAAGIIVGLEGTIEPVYGSVEADAKKLEAVVIPVAKHVGTPSDSESRALLNLMCGPNFEEACHLFFSTFVGHPYDDSHIRKLTADDERHALRLDRHFAQNAVNYLNSEDGAYLLEEPELNPTGGCPLLRAPGQSGSLFTDVCKAMAWEYSDPGSGYFRQGYPGVAELILLRASARWAEEDWWRRMRPEIYERYQGGPYRSEYDLKFPEFEVVKQELATQA